jgi:hypothetical protein
MTPVLIASLFDPVFWAIGSVAVLGGYRLPKRSWIRLLLAIVCFPSMIGVVDLQSHLLHGLYPTGFDPKMIDYMLFPDIFGGFFFMICVAMLEDRAKKRREAAGSQPAVDASTGVVSGKK